MDKPKCWVKNLTQLPLPTVHFLIIFLTQHFDGPLLLNHMFVIWITRNNAGLFEPKIG